MSFSERNTEKFLHQRRRRAHTYARHKSHREIEREQHRKEMEKMSNIYAMALCSGKNFSSFFANIKINNQNTPLQPALHRMYAIWNVVHVLTHAHTHTQRQKTVGVSQLAQLQLKPVQWYDFAKFATPFPPHDFREPAEHFVHSAHRMNYAK